MLIIRLRLATHHHQRPMIQHILDFPTLHLLYVGATPLASDERTSGGALAHRCDDRLIAERPLVVRMPTDVIASVPVTVR